MRQENDQNRKIAIYCRVSTDDQAEHGFNLREQELRIDQYINAYIDEFPEERVKYIDDGFSAKDLKRREMRMLLEDVKDGLISKVVIHNLDRLTRNMKDLIYLIELFEEKEVQLFSLKEKIDTKTAVGRFFVSIIILVAQWEREAISERTIRALDQSAYEGNYVHGRAPFGYRLENKKLVVKENEAEIIKNIYDMYLFDGYSINEIFHFHGSKYRDMGFVWSYDRVRIILNNELYTGVYKNKRIVIDNHSPQIISKEIFKQTKIMLNYKNKMESYDYLFKGLCFDFKTLKRLNHKSVVKPNRVYLYYENCNRVRINEDMVDEQIGDFIDRFIEITKDNVVKSKIDILKNKDYNLKILSTLLDSGLIDRNYYSDQKDLLKNDIANREKIIIEIIGKVTGWSTMEVGQRKKFLMKNVKKIIIDLDSKKIVNVKFRDSIKLDIDKDKEGVTPL